MTETTRILRDLVRLPSVNPMGRDLSADIVGEQRVAAYLEEFFRGHGIPCQRQTAAEKRDNVVARVNSPGAKRTLLFEVHQDSVPVDGMTVEPFAAAIEGDRLYGRGACDVKGGMAAMLSTIARLAREKPRSANVILACTVDEEHTSLGVKELVRRGVRADMAVVAEPTRLDIVHAHKGVVRWHVRTAGRSCHSSSPEQGVSAIYRMGRLLHAIEKFGETLRNKAADPLLGPPTLSVGRIEGGASANTVPDWCRIEVDRRLIRGETPDAALKEFQEALAASVEVAFECSPPFLSSVPLDPAGAEELIDLLGAAIDKVRGGHTVRPVPFGTDAPSIAASGIPAVVFGPGDIAQAHTKDEWVSLDEVAQASEILFQLAIAAG